MNVSKVTLLSSLLFLLLGAVTSFAQDQNLVAIGINGEEESAGRNPTLTVAVRSSENGVELIADVSVKNPDSRNYPIELKYFINGQLEWTQMTSPQLPRNLAVTVGEDIATPPFNYAISASYIHPQGRPYATIIQGAVFATQLTATLDCTYSEGQAESADSREFLANDVQIRQLNNTSASLGAEADQVSGPDVVKLSITLSFDENDNASGSILVEEEGELSTTTLLSGTANFDSSANLTGLDLSSEDGLTDLSCD